MTDEGSTDRFSRVLMVATPFVAMAALAVGLRVGAGSAERAAIVSASPASSHSPVTTWPMMVFDEDLGQREAATHVPLVVQGKAGGKTALWRGETNEDGAAEVLLDLPPGPIDVDVQADGHALAFGTTAVPAVVTRDPLTSGWARFARREGDVVMDVALLGQRAASGFPASVWVHATDGKTQAPLASVAIAIEPDPGLTPAAPSVVTDDRGWAHIAATPLGYSVPLVLHAKDGKGRAGEWAGGIFVSPGASGIVAKELYAPDESVAFDVIVPTVRTTAYVEIDDVLGRAWAAAVPMPASANATPRATVTGPKLAPGLYWIVAAGEVGAATTLGPGTIARPFFVAGSADKALAFGTDASTCAAPGDVRDASRAMSACLSLVNPTAVPRWLALDGFVYRHQRDALQRARGVLIAIVALLLAIGLEAVLILRAAALARKRVKAAEASAEGGNAPLQAHGWNVAVGVLLAMLGFALLGAFLVRLA
jgi:hypothetical protein